MYYGILCPLQWSGNAPTLQYLHTSDTINTSIRTNILSMGNQDMYCIKRKCPHGMQKTKAIAWHKVMANNAWSYGICSHGTHDRLLVKVVEQGELKQISS